MKRFTLFVVPFLVLTLTLGSAYAASADNPSGGKGPAAGDILKKPPQPKDQTEPDRGRDKERDGGLKKLPQPKDQTGPVGGGRP
jgi:hypothetical protein